MTEIINVGMADFKITKSPNLLTTVGLGSCVAVCLYDRERKVGGMAHFMLPDSQGNSHGNPQKYADFLLPLMLKELHKQGASRTNLLAKIAGGSQMFSFNGTSQVLKIGERNIEAAEKELKKLGIRLLAADVGGTSGRTVSFDLANGRLVVKTINQGEKVI